MLLVMMGIYILIRRRELTQRLKGIKMKRFVIKRVDKHIEVMEFNGKITGHGVCDTFEEAFKLLMVIAPPDKKVYYIDVVEEV